MQGANTQVRALRVREFRSSANSGVLDLGCGAGDVTFVAADLVGPDGCVVGVDCSPDGLARARLRAGQRGLTQVQFMAGWTNLGHWSTLDTPALC